MSFTKRKAFLLAGIALALLIAYVAAAAVKARPLEFAGAPASAQTQLPAIWDLPVDKIARIIAEPLGGEALIFERSETLGWVLASPLGLRYDASIAEGIAPNAARLVPEKEIGSHTDGLAQYGLDAPAVIRLFLDETADGNESGEYDILLGAATSTGDAYYFTVSADNIVYTMNAEKARSLLLDSLNVLDKNVLGFNRSLRPSAIAEKIINITVNGSAPADAQSLAVTLARLNALEFFDASDLTKYGLDTPRLTIAFENEYGSHTLYIGNAAGDGEYCAMTEGFDAVFTVPARGLDGLAQVRSD
jgi:hypothetical protein